jgi:plasmid stabilization system protein ParE
VTLDFVDEARAEFLAALSFYKRVNKAVARRFRDLVDEHTALIEERPELFSLREGGYRRVNLPGFPYYLPYIVRGERVWIVAVAHGSRQPEYWIDRMARFPDEGA